MDSTSMAKGALSSVTGVFSARKEKQTIALLIAENEELKKLERLRPQLMELQQKLNTIQKEKQELEKAHSDESISILEHNKELAIALKESRKLAEKYNAEKDDGLALANEWSSKAEKADKEVRRLNEELEDIKDRMADIRAHCIDPEVINQFNDKIIELESKSILCLHYVISVILILHQ